MTFLPPVPDTTTENRPARSVVRTLAGGGVVGAGVGVLGYLAGARLAGPTFSETLRAMPHSGPALIGQLLAAWFVSTLVHEVGHLAGGALQGFRFQMLVVGPLRIARDPVTERIGVGFNRQLELAGGLAGCMPRSEDRLLARLQWMVLSGPLASVLLAALGALLWRAMPAAPWSGFVLITAMLAGVTALATLLPMQNGSFLTDGKRFLHLRSNSAAAHRDAAMLLRTVRDRAGHVLAAEPASAILPLLEPVDGSMFELVGRSTAACWLVDRGAFAEAKAHLARAAAIAAGLPFHLDAAVALEQAFLAARADGDAAAARALIAPHDKALRMVPAPERLRVDAAIALAAGDTDTARRCVDEARALLLAAPTARTGSSKWTLARLEEMTRELR